MMSIPRELPLRTIGILLIAATICIAVSGLSSTITHAENPSPLAKIKSLGLESDEVGRVTAYFASKDREHAERLASLSESAAAYFERELGASFPLHLAVLAPEHWFVPYASGDGEPYGMPWAWVDDLLMTAPASLEEGVLIRGSDENANLRRVQFVLLHEFGHLANKQFLHPDSPHPYSSVRWLEELLSTYFAYAFVQTHDPDWAETSRVQWQEFVEGYTPAVVSLDWGFMRDLSPQEFVRTYAWYQNLLNLRAAELYEEHGLDFLKSLRSELAWDESDQWTTETLLPHLETIAPGFKAWADDLPNGQRSRLAITPVTVIDVRNGALLTGQTVLVEGDRIVTVGPAGEVAVPDGADFVDGEDGYLIPGLWDMHAHGTTYGREESFFRLFLANGITGFRDPFGSLKVADNARDAVQAGALPGPPRVIAAGNMVDGPPGMVAGAVVASSPAEGRRIVEALHAEGAPFIKVYFMLAPETYHAIAKRSRELGLPFAGHVPMLVSAADASDAGQRSIEHMTGVLAGCSTDEEAVLAAWQEYLAQLKAGDMAGIAENVLAPVHLALTTQDEDRCRQLLERFGDNQTWQVPTLVSLRGKAYLRENAAKDDPRTDYFTPTARWTGGRPFGFPMTDEQWKILQGQYEREKEIVGMMANAGIPLLAGSDTATPWAFPGFGLHDELELLVKAGLTPLHALQAATLNPARFFERTDELGSVAEGMLADLVLLEANPLDNIRNTQQIRAVIADGRLYRRAELDQILDEVAISVEKTHKEE